jgi:hypothetical protein
VLTPSVTIVSNAVDATTAIRTVTLSRAVAGATNEHYSIPKTPGQIDLITAVGNTPTIAYHASRTGSKITLLPTKVGACLCQPDVHKYLKYMDISTMEYKVHTHHHSYFLRTFLTHFSHTFLTHFSRTLFSHTFLAHVPRKLCFAHFPRPGELCQHAPW